MTPCESCGKYPATASWSDRPKDGEEETFVVCDRCLPVVFGAVA